jgi:hypothetical protein
MKQPDKKNTIMLVIAVVIIIAAIMFWPKNQDRQNKKAGNAAGDGLSGGAPKDTPLDNAGGGNAGGGRNNSGGGNNNGGGYIPPVNNAFPLKKGSKNNYVKELQMWLNHDNVFFKRGRVPLVVDGGWGQKTEDAYRSIFGGDGEVIEGEFIMFKDRRTKGDPAFTWWDDTPQFNWPLHLRHKGPKTQKLNIALGLYKKGTTDKMSAIYSAATLDAVNKKIGFNTVSESVYDQIVGKSRPMGMPGNI